MLTAKEYLIANDKSISEAIEQGYDIRLSEDEILNAMEKYSEYTRQFTIRNDLINFAKWLAFDYEYGQGGSAETVDMYIAHAQKIINCKHEWRHPIPDNGGKSICVKCGISG